MPTIIVLVLATKPVLTLCMMLGSDWPPEALDAARLALATSVAVVVVWVVVDGCRAVTDRWRRFISRPH